MRIRNHRRRSRLLRRLLALNHNRNPNSNHRSSRYQNIIRSHKHKRPNHARPNNPPTRSRATLVSSIRKNAY